MDLPELLMPAGNIEKAYYAFRYGADAIYCGSPMFSLRTRMNTFTEENIAEITEYAHKNNKKVYVTVNGFPHEFMIETIKKHLQFIEKVKPDGLIIADTGVLALAKEYAPSVEKHLSVQTSTVNIPSIKFWMESGITRVILAREMSLEEVKKIHKALPDLELETFVHGSICMAYSGRCLLSNFMSGRDANRGACSHSCRWNYRVYDENGYEVSMVDTKNSTSSSLHITSEEIQKFQEKKRIEPDFEGEALGIHTFEKKMYWEEEQRQGEIIPVEEDFHGTHIMSSRDMCMIENLKDVLASGVCSLKVEGRNKTIYYLSLISRAYRQALDDIKNNKPFNESLWRDVQSTGNRGFFAGFSKGKPQVPSEQYEANLSYSSHDFVGVVKEWKEGRLFFNVKNRIDIGDTIEFILPKIQDDFSIKASNLIKDEEPVDALHGGNGDGWMDCVKEVEKGVLMRKLK
jgi:U32 family peptidase